MKNLFILIVILSGVTGLTGCKKNYECFCTGPGNTGSNFYYGVTKTEAEDLCDLSQTNNAAAWGSATCTLSEQ